MSTLRNCIRSTAICLVSGLLLIMRPLKFLYPVYPRHLRVMLRTWTPRMLWLAFRSGGRRVYVDEPCGFREPTAFQPRVSVSPELQLSEEEIRRFWQQGFLGPFRMLPEDEIPEMRAHMERVLKQESGTYGFRTTRDLHLESPRLMGLLTHPAVVERAAQLLGPNLLVWRSNVFEKRAGSAEIVWHQGTTFLMEQFYKPALEPRDKETFFEIGVWLAIDEANAANGCMQALPGSYRDIGTIRLTGKKKFHAASFEPEYNIDPASTVKMECRPGEFYLFSERVIHGSEPNRSDRDRMSMVWRYVEPDTAVFRDETTHLVLTFNQRFPLARYACVLARGADTAKINKVIRPESVREPLPAKP